MTISCMLFLSPQAEPLVLQAGVANSQREEKKSGGSCDAGKELELSGNFEAAWRAYSAVG